MVEYGGFGRVILFFAVLAAVGVVAIPSGVIASGFAEIVASKLKSSNPEEQHKLTGKKGDDWFDIQKEALKGVPPPPSKFGPRVDALQLNVLWYFEGKEDETTKEHVRSGFSKAGRAFFFVMIISNVIAVICESVPEIDKSVGNKSANFFDVFEALSVLYFTSGNYSLCLALFCTSLYYFVHVSNLTIYPQASVFTLHHSPSLVSSSSSSSANPITAPNASNKAPTGILYRAMPAMQRNIQTNFPPTVKSECA